MPDFFFELISRTDEERRTFEGQPMVLDAVGHGMSLGRYQKLLSELYHVVWHFNPTCAAAASRMTDQHAETRYFLYRHMEEESGHERWVLNDLRAIGADADGVARPSSAIQGLVGYNYWAADRQNACSVLGMMYVLEVIASVYGGPFSTAIKESLMLQGELGVSFIGSHATMDAQHMVDLRGQLNLIEDTPSQDAVLASAKVNFELLTAAFVAI